MMSQQRYFKWPRFASRHDLGLVLNVRSAVETRQSLMRVSGSTSLVLLVPTQGKPGLI